MCSVLLHKHVKPGFHPNATHATDATQAIAFGWKPGLVTIQEEEKEDFCIGALSFKPN